VLLAWANNQDWRAVVAKAVEWIFGEDGRGGGREGGREGRRARGRSPDRGRSEEA